MEVLLERRTRTLLELILELPEVRDSDSYWDHAVEVFSRNQKDVPLALFYTAGSDDKSMDDISSFSEATDDHRHYSLRRTIGLPKSPPVGFEQLDIRLQNGITKFLEQAATVDEPITVDLSQDLESLGATGELRLQIPSDLCKLAVICPLRPVSSKKTLLGFMVLGLSQKT